MIGLVLCELETLGVRLSVAPGEVEAQIEVMSLEAHESGGDWK